MHRIPTLPGSVKHLIFLTFTLIKYVFNANLKNNYLHIRREENKTEVVSIQKIKHKIVYRAPYRLFIKTQFCSSSFKRSIFSINTRNRNLDWFVNRFELLVEILNVFCAVYGSFDVFKIVKLTRFFSRTITCVVPFKHEPTNNKTVPSFDLKRYVIAISLKIFERAELYK